MGSRGWRVGSRKNLKYFSEKVPPYAHTYLKDADASDSGQ